MERERAFTVEIIAEFENKISSALCRLLPSLVIELQTSKYCFLFLI